MVILDVHANQFTWVGGNAGWGGGGGVVTFTCANSRGWVDGERRWDAGLRGERGGGGKLRLHANQLT